jgi:hypothetical protein
MAHEEEMRFLLAMPAGHEPDWPGAYALVAGISDEVLEQLAPECSAILGSRVVSSAVVLRRRLHNALAELRAAMEGALLPNGRDNRERHVLGNADVLMEPHPRERRTLLVGFIELLDHVGVLDVLGCEALCAPEDALAQVERQLARRAPLVAEAAREPGGST